MNCEFLCVTFRRDWEYTRYMLRSLKKFATGFAGITIAVPNEDYVLFLPLEKEYSEIPAKVVSYDDVPGKGFLKHMIMVMQADLLCPNAEFIAHIDSDCMYTQPVTPEEYFHEGKPVLLYEPYATMTHVGRLRWKSAVESALGGISENEFMCRHPAVHYHWLYSAARKAMARHADDWEADWLNGPNEFPQQKCEYSTLGEVVWRQFRDKYQLELNDERFKDKGKLRQFWSHCPVDQALAPDTETQRQKMDKILDDKPSASL